MGFLLAAAGASAQAGLATLIADGQREAALELLRLGADANDAQGDGTSALHWAVYKVDPELVGRLLAREAEPNTRNLFGSTPLAEAVKVGDAGMVRMLLEAGAEANAPNQDNQTPLMLAARTGITEVAALLLEHGADVNVVEQWRGQNAVMWAAAQGHADMTELLVAHGADVNLRAHAFDWGSQISSEPRAQYRPTGGMTPLLYAARSGCLRCARAILDAGADIDLPDPDGVTPLMVAIDNFNFDVAEYLLGRGANPHAWDWWGRTALYIAVDVHSLGERGAAVQGAVDVARLLLEAGVNRNPQLNMHRPGRGGNSGRFTDDLLNSGATPLLRAANSQDAVMTRLLLEHGALVDLPNAMGVTPFMAAAGFGNARGVLGGRFSGDVEPRAIETLELLLAAGADIEARVLDTTSRTARIARRSSMTDREGQSSLHAAASQGWLRVAQWLLDQGADARAADAMGRTPLDAAMGNAGGRNDRPIEPMVTLLKNAL